MTWDVKGKTILITGATSGIGLEASVQLAKRGAKIVMVGRDAAKTSACVADVVKRSGSDAVESLLCDFSKQSDVRKLAEDYRAKYDRLDVLLNNAGTVFKTRSLTSDGIESTFAVNHLAYFLLTNLLLDLVVKSAPARIVNVSSRGHYRGTMDFDDLGFEKGYFIMSAYSRSKLGNVMFTKELAKKLETKGVTVNCLHPGAVATNIWSGAPGWSKPLIYGIASWFFITAEKGGANLVNLVANPTLDGVTGKYFDEMKQVAESKLAQDGAVARRLWEVSAKLTGLVPA